MPAIALGLRFYPRRAATGQEGGEEKEKPPENTTLRGWCRGPFAG